MRLVIVCLIIAVLTGCARKRVVEEEMPPVVDSKVAALETDNNAFADDDRQLSYEVYYRLSTEDPNHVYLSLVSLVERYDGYILESSKNKTVFRLQAEYFNEAVTEIESYGEVVDKKITGTDVSEQYVDLNKRLENARTSRQKYLDLLNSVSGLKEATEIR